MKPSPRTLPLTFCLVIVFATFWGLGQPLLSSLSLSTAEALITSDVGVTLEPDRESQADPGTTAVYTHTLKNTSDITHTLTITAISSAAFPRLVDPLTQDLPPDVEAQVTVTVTVPDDAAGGIVDTTTVEVTSESNPGVLVASATNKTTVNIVAGVSIAPDQEPERTVRPGHSIVYTHLITNTGNTTDTLRVETESDFEADLGTSDVALELELAARAHVTVAVTVTVPKLVSSGEEGITKVKVTSKNDSNVTASVENTTTSGDHSGFLPIVLRQSEWEQVKTWPNNEAAISLAVCATDPRKIFAGTLNKLLFLSGEEWHDVGPPGQGNNAVTGIVFDENCEKVFISLYNNGVWQGVHTSGVWGGWRKLAEGENVAQVRAIVLADGILYAAGDFGIRYYQAGQWKQTSAPGSADQPIMHMSVADPVTNSGLVYAVQWLNRQILVKRDQPETWNRLGLPNTPDEFVRTVFATSRGVEFVGTNDRGYRFLTATNTWQNLEVAAGLRAAVIVNNVAYLGYAGGKGVYRLPDGASIPALLNNGWLSIPPTVYALISIDGKLYAATTNGVWVRQLP